MNFYKHHIGDYDADTAHLSWLEDAAYSRLMRLYYRREAPIPADLGQACRLVRATSKQEREAVDLVLREFFVLEADGWHNKRCDEEVAAAQAKAEKNRMVGKLGGRPHKSETTMVSENNHHGFQKEPNDNPSQTPDSRLQTPEKTKGAEGARGKPQKFDPLAIDLPATVPKVAWEAWVAYRRTTRKTLNATTVTAQLAKLSEWAAMGHDPTSIITQSIEKGWAGLFEPKTERKTTHEQRADFYAEATGRNRQDGRVVEGHADRVD